MPDDDFEVALFEGAERAFKDFKHLPDEWTLEGSTDTEALKEFAWFAVVRLLAPMQRAASDLRGLVGVVNA